MPRQKKIKPETSDLSELSSGPKDIIDRSIIELPKEDGETHYEKPKSTLEIPPSVITSETGLTTTSSEHQKKSKTESINVVEQKLEKLQEPKQEKSKRKARYEAGSVEAKEHMKKLREIKAQKRAQSLVVV